MKAAAAVNAADLKNPITTLSDLEIADQIKELVFDKKLSQLLIIVVKDDGTAYTADNGLSIDETYDLLDRYKEWIEQGRRKIM